jgi:hypothetical protein
MSEFANRQWPHARWGVCILALTAVACGTDPPGNGAGSTGGMGPGPGGGAGPGPGPMIEGNVDPGRVEIHRLNNKEYNNTVRDLLGTQSQPAAEFLAQEGLHFDNTASALGMTPTLYEGYFNAARDLLAEASATTKFLTCTPTAAADACARQILENFGFKVYRRPLDKTEVDRAMKVYDAEFARSMSGTEAIKLAVRAMLSAANFLYRIEYDTDPASSVPHSLSAYELASRLSYLAWSTMPDDALFGLANSGAIFDTAKLETEVDRLIGDGKSAEFVESFAGQWLDVRDLVTHSIVPQVFPTYTNELADAMLVENYLWFQEFLNQDRSLTEWFTGDFNYVNDVLAQHYGMTPPGGGGQFTRVSVTTDQRRGFLGLASFLTHTSFPSRTSPTLRGTWILSELLCDPPPAPPPDVPELADSAAPDEMDQPSGAENVKERLERHRTDPACAGCHRILDPMGLGLERFDGIGRYRETYGNNDPIDPAGTLPDGTMFSGPDQLATILSTDPRFTACVASKLYTYALGRDVETLDTPILDKLKANWSTRAGGLTLRNLMKEVVISSAFRFRRGEGQ